MAINASATDMKPFSGVDEPLLRGVERGLEHGLEHGGELAAARRLFPAAPEPFIDLSTGINPNPFPLPQLSSDVFARLPETDAVVAPTYSEHARAAALAGHAVTEIGNLAALGGCNLAFVTNPNNPDGRLLC